MASRSCGPRSWITALRKLLLATTALVVFATGADAAPVFTAWALIQNGAGWAAALGAAFSGSAFVSVAGTLILYDAASARSRR